MNNEGNSQPEQHSRKATINRLRARPWPPATAGGRSFSPYVAALAVRAVLAVHDLEKALGGVEEAPTKKALRKN